MYGHCDELAASQTASHLQDDDVDVQRLSSDRQHLGYGVVWR